MLSAILSAKSEAALALLPLITRQGAIRASAPKNGNAKYVWRMVAFAVSTDPKQHCMPCTADFGVVPPADWCVEPPTAWLLKERARVLHPGYFQSGQQPVDLNAHLLELWTRYGGYGRRQHYIKTVLDPIVDEIVSSVPPRYQRGTARWARVYGVA